MARRRRTPSAPRAAAAARPRATATRTFDGSIHHTALVWLVGLKVAGIVLTVDLASVQSFDLPKTLLSHAFAWVIAGVLVAAFVRFGFALVPRTRLHLAALALLGAYVLSTVFAEDRYIALYGEWKRYLGLTFALDMAVLYLAVAVAFRTVRDWAVFVAVAGGAIALSLLYAFVQWRGLDPVRWADDPRPRPFATIGNADIYGQLLSLSLGGALGIVLFVGDRRWRIAAGLLTIGILAMSAIVATRGSVLGIAAAVAGAAGLALLGVRERRIDRRLVAGTTAAMAVAAIVVFAFTPLGQRIRETFVGGAEIRDRLVIWKAAFEAFRDRPLVGWGPDGLAVAYPRFSQPEGAGVLGVNSILSSAHDWVLQTASSLGAVGLAAELAFYGAAAWLLIRAFGREPRIAGPLLLAFAAYLAHGLVSVGSISVDWLPAIACGGAAALAAPAPAVAARRRTEPVVEAVAVAAALFAASFGAVPLQASHDAQRAQFAVLGKDGATAVAYARSAVDRDRGRAIYWKLLAQGFDAQGQWKLAGDAHAEDAAREPSDPTAWESLAVSRARQALAGDQSSGGQQAALEAARRAAELDRYNPAGYIVQAEVANAFGQWDLGMRSAAMALHLARNDKNFRNDINFQTILIEAAVATTDYATARELMEGLVAENDSPRLRGAIALVAQRQGDRAAAIANAKRALELDPNNELGLRVLRELGQ